MNQKYIAFILMLVIVPAALAACSASATDANTTNTAVTSTLSESFNDALPTRAQLIVGTLLLEGTDRQVTPEQTRELLPLWQGSRLLQRTGTGAREEIAAVLSQIEGIMSVEQMQAIEQMQLTRDSLQETAQSFGMTVGGEFGGSGGSGQRGQGSGQSQRITPNTSEMLLDQLLTILEDKLK